MMLHFEYLKNEIVFDDGFIQLLAIENKELFRNTLLAFEHDDTKSLFVFSENSIPIEFSKLGYFILNPPVVDLQNKRLTSKINSFLCDAANNDFQQELAQLKSELMNFAEKLGAFCEFDIEWCDDIDALSVIKLFQFRINSNSQAPAELFVTYILLLNRYLKINFFIVANLHMYFSENELEEIYESLLLRHINLLAIEPSKPESVQACEKIHIVDADLCDIDIEIIK